jgi:hypothetical protein
MYHPYFPWREAVLRQKSEVKHHIFRLPGLITFSMQKLDISCLDGYNVVQWTEYWMGSYQCSLAGKVSAFYTEASTVSPRDGQATITYTDLKQSFVPVIITHNVRNDPGTTTGLTIG